jgi:hypothetical protein
VEGPKRLQVFSLARLPSYVSTANTAYALERPVAELGSQMRLRFLIVSLVAMQAAKGTLLIMLQPYYPHDLTQWIATLYPPWQRLQTPAPYGLPWYVLYAPGLLGLPVLSLSLAVAEGLTLLYLFRRNEPYIAGTFALTSALIFFWDPFDLWSYLFTLLSIKWRPLLAAAILVKIPLGAPMWVWQFILTASLRTQGNWPHYVILGIWWIGILWYVSGLASRLNLEPNRVGQIIVQIIGEMKSLKTDFAVSQYSPIWSEITSLRYCLR